MPSELEIATARVIAWKRSKPTLLLDPGQRRWVDKFKSSEGATVWCIGRQRGKTYAAMAYACEFAMQNPGSIIRYAAKTKESARGIVLPTLSQLFEWCPEGLRPELDESSATWGNGSALTWAGTDAQSFDRLRGPRAHLIILDESGFYQDLERVEAALLPQLTTTQGKVLYLSTPPESLAHPFTNRFRAAQATGRSEHETIHDNPRLTDAQKVAILKNYAEGNGLELETAEKSTFWRREYLAEFVTEESRAAIPSWCEAMERACVREFERPKYFDAYVSCDFGFGHGHGALFAFFDFAQQRLFIEDALYLKNKNVTQFAEAVKKRELELWGVERYDGTLVGAADWGKLLPDYLRASIRAEADGQPYLRVGDDNALILSELVGQHGLAVLPTKKDEKHVAVDAVDQAFRLGQIVIHPRANELVKSLYATVWNKARSQWEEGPFGHGELIDCIVYMHRNLRKGRDPRPRVRSYFEFNPPNEDRDGWGAALGLT